MASTVIDLLCLALVIVVCRVAVLSTWLVHSSSTSSSSGTGSSSGRILRRLVDADGKVHSGWRCKMWSISQLENDYLLGASVVTKC